MWEVNPRLIEIPSSERRMAVAQTIGGSLVREAAGAGRRAEDYAAALGWSFEQRALSSPHLQAILAPMLAGGFTVVLNSDWARGPAQQLWLFSHEVGHSLFWSPGAPPRRIVPAQPGEESFCDDFASDLTAALGVVPHPRPPDFSHSPPAEL